MIGRGDESPLSYFLDMNIETIKSKVEEWLQPLLEEKDFFLVDVKVSMGKKIEVYVDTDTGIHIDDCAQVSRFLEKNLDGSGLVPENYILEVSSPGMSNPLKVPRQFKRRIGRKLEVLKTNGDKIEAVLEQVNEEGIKLREHLEIKKNKKNKNEPEPQPREFDIPFSDIKKATLVF